MKNPHRTSALKPRCFRRWTEHITAGCLLAAAGLPQAGMAAVEYVTYPGVCGAVDTVADGDDLSLQAGNNIRFEVWGDGIDVNPAVRVTVDDNNNDRLVIPRIIRPYNAAENLARGCGAKGSVLVEVDSPGEAGATRQRSLWFRMPLGDESRLHIRVVPFRTPVWQFQGVTQMPNQCLTHNIGTATSDLNNARLTITLPPGAATDTSNCAVQITTRVDPADRPQIDITQPFRYGLNTPPMLSLAGTQSDVAPGALSSAIIRFNADVADIRRTATLRSMGMIVAAPNPNRTDTLNLVIRPPPASNAFTQAVQCNNSATGTTVNVNDSFNCEIRLAQTPPATGQPISFEVRDRLCVAAGSTTVTYSSATGIGSFTAPSTGTIHQIPLRALGGQTSANTPCADRLSPVSHDLFFWVGPRDTPSGPDYSRASIRIRIVP